MPAWCLGRPSSLSNYQTCCLDFRRAATAPPTCILVDRPLSVGAGHFVWAPCAESDPGRRTQLSMLPLGPHPCKPCGASDAPAHAQTWRQDTSHVLGDAWLPGGGGQRPMHTCRQSRHMAAQQYRMGVLWESQEGACVRAIFCTEEPPWSHSLHRSAAAAHYPYDWGWLGKAPSGQWVLAQGPALGSACRHRCRSGAEKCALSDSAFALMLAVFEGGNVQHLVRSGQMLCFVVVTGLCHEGREHTFGGRLRTGASRWGELLRWADRACAIMCATSCGMRNIGFLLHNPGELVAVIAILSAEFGASEITHWRLLQLDAAMATRIGGGAPKLPYHLCALQCARGALARTWPAPM